MKQRIATLFLALIAVHALCMAQLTLPDCLQRADENYPLIRRFRLIENSLTLSLSDINKGWLPHIETFGQATLQNSVPGFPESFRDILSAMGKDMEGLSKLQYKIGVDLNQTVWDGGMSAARRKSERARSEEMEAGISVQLYAMHEKVINLYFGILLMDEQIAQTCITLDLLRANLKQLQAMKANGVAMQADVDMVEAQLLTMTQRLSDARSAVKAYRNQLGLFIGQDISDMTLELPAAEMPDNLTSDRPELRLYNARLRSNAAGEQTLDASLRPRVGFFAQAYYGYPGLNYFKSMMDRNLSFNILAGIKLSWTIDPLYTRRNTRDRLRVNAASIENERELFLFNSSLESRSETDAIDGLREVMKDDARIIELRTNVRRAAESQLRNGIIDATALLTKITDENQARMTARYHEIQLLQKIYQLRHTLNR